ncbi:probable xyloglucan endotransglucosylase/hydrolase protein 32 [Nymphaea colorata]|nr:probable xyloglucan endotransglucosylase/hydrolase protein 32 [Nymphaea colorata]
MASLSLSLFLVIILEITLISISSGLRPPSPGYYPTSMFPSAVFYRYFTNLWGPQHQSVSPDQSSVTIWLDRATGSGFKSRKPFRSGYFGASIKLQTGYTAGVITAFYLSNNEAHPGMHDEVDIEFLGTTPGKPYTLQTNVYINGSGDRKIIGREMKFHLWFDPTADFHHYAILWNPREIIFFVDNIPIRIYPRKSRATFPLRPMWVYGSIWDASSWATENGRYKADYRYQPFVAWFSRFIMRGCSAYAPMTCRHVAGSPVGAFGLTYRQRLTMHWAQRYYMVYDYCKDYTRDRSLTPECWSRH